MLDVYFVITIVDRANGDKLTKLFLDKGAKTIFSLPGEGTAADEVLDVLGLEATEKSVLLSVATRDVKLQVMHDLVYRMMIDAPGAGIAMSVPVSSLGGVTALKALLGDAEQTENSEERAMKDILYTLIMVIANSGCTDMVMDAARGAGATGGTVLHVKGAGAEHAAKFFGMSIVDEKEIIMIAALKSAAADIMRAIMSGAGLNTRAHAICFTLPVDQIAGFRLLREEAQ